ncbi:N-formylglutamate amidohydrolase [Erythrobacter sp. HL-111]|uniref:N-formylglutamate amidohydrolase n=1 Tax=Erythrobacter sp. HL-111 TaxID=1798193 RepID=UPI0006D99A88|nr:N-formylglutamate amidohydrolase [Erythrobacter sp. HL-111]KPP95015.1 MAG: N-formylglutamate amidohydrolase [Erythrobacteraceae bacterium HL-111]SDS11672.1 N-formylglutamate amidohydrolase [Erythrobacter sp. HL-111]
MTRQGDPGPADPTGGEPISGRPQGSITIEGGAIGDPACGPAFTYHAPRAMPLPVLIAVPHAGRVYPGETLAAMRDVRLSQLRLEDRLIDLVAREAARLTGAALLVAHAPRAVLDLNRAEDDVDWGMVRGGEEARRKAQPDKARAEKGDGKPNHRARSGLGLVPRRLPGFGEIWNRPLAPGEIEARIERIHRPYHALIERELRRVRAQWGGALLVDLHSMPPLRRQAGEDRPARFVLGDRFGASCSARLVGRAFRHLDAEGCASAHNRPYAGGYVLDRHAAPARGLHAIQVEVCRSAYLDVDLAEPTDEVGSVAQVVAGLVRELGAETARLAPGDDFAQAAE